MVHMQRVTRSRAGPFPLVARYYETCQIIWKYRTWWKFSFHLFCFSFHCKVSWGPSQSENEKLVETLIYKIFHRSLKSFFQLWQGVRWKNERQRFYSGIRDPFIVQSVTWSRAFSSRCSCYYETCQIIWEKRTWWEFAFHLLFFVSLPSCLGPIAAGKWEARRNADLRNISRFYIFNVTTL